MDNVDRRQGDRVQPAFRVRTEVLPETGDIHMAVFADIVNLSEEGICLRSPLRLSERDRIIVYLPMLKDKEPLEIHGSVRWVKEAGPLMYQIGMKFTGIPKIRETTLHAEIKAIMESYFNQQSMRIDT